MSNTTKYNCLIFSILFLLCGISTSIAADNQPLNYPIDTVNGQAMYRYSVEKGEGLYRVSQKFGISQNEIMRVNPNIKADGLKLGQVLYIPIQAAADNQAAGQTAAETAVNGQDTAFIYHVIQPKETLFGLSKHYGVPIKQIEELNPKLVPKLPTGKTLRIPRTVSAIKAVTLEVGEPEIIGREIVQTTIGMITPDSLNSQTAETATNIITADSAKHEAPEIILSEEDIPAEQRDSDKTLISPVEYGEATQFINLNDSNEQIPIRVAYLLPLMLDASKRDANIDRFLEFYEGSLLAINDLQKHGLRIEAYAYDIEKNDITLQATLQNPALKTVDAIIGPAYPAQVEMVAKMAKEERIPAIVPFTPNISGLDTNQYILRFNLSTEQDAQLMIDFMENNQDKIHAVMVDLEKDEVSDFYKLMNEQIKKSRLSSAITKMSGLQQALKQNKENLLLFSSTKLQDIQPLFTELNSLAWDYNLALIGQYGWGKSEIPLRMYYTSVFDANDTIKEDLYIEEFNRYYNYPLSNIRPRYDMLGYDITVYTINMLYKNQLNNEDNRPLQEIIPTIGYKGIQSDIHFEQITPEGGFINHGHVAVRKEDRHF